MMFSLLNLFSLYYSFFFWKKSRRSTFYFYFKSPPANSEVFAVGYLEGLLNLVIKKHLPQLYVISNNSNGGHFWRSHFVPNNGIRALFIGAKLLLRTNHILKHLSRHIEQM